METKQISLWWRERFDVQSYSFWNLLQEIYLFIIAGWLIVAVLLRRNRHYKKYLIFSGVVYIAVLLYVTLLGRTAKSEYQMELSFLWEYRLALSGKTGWWMQIFDNIMLFVPMGWLYGELTCDSAELSCRSTKLNRRSSKILRCSSWKKSVVIGACISFFIEFCQLVFKLGLFEFDDILNNTIGMMAGYGLCVLVKKPDI